MLNKFFDSVQNGYQGGPKMADGVWKEGYPWVLGRSRQLLLNKFFDRSTPSMSKVDYREKRKQELPILFNVFSQNFKSFQHPQIVFLFLHFVFSKKNCNHQMTLV